MFLQLIKYVDLTVFSFNLINNNNSTCKKKRKEHNKNSIQFLFNINLLLQTQPVEEFYRVRGKLLEFDLPGGIPESWPKLLQALNLQHDDKKSAAA